MMNIIKKKSNQSIVIIIILAIISIISRFYNLGFRSFDGDEGVILQIAEGSFHSLWRIFTNDVHPPLFHLLTWLSFHVFGVSEFSARFFSAVAGIAIIYCTYRLAQEFLSQNQAIIVAILCIFSPYLLFFSQESRMYSLLIATVIFTTWQLVVYIKRKQSSNLVFWLIGGIAAVWTHHIALLIIGIQLIVAVCVVKDYKKIGLVSLVGILAYLPLASKTINQFAGRLAEQESTGIMANITGIINGVYRFVPGRTFLNLDPSPAYNIAWLKADPIIFLYFLVTLLLPTGLVLIGLNQLWRHNKQLFWIIFSSFALFIILGLVSSEIGPRAARYFGITAPLFYIALTAGIFSFKKSIRLFFLIVIIGIMCGGIYRYYTKEQYAVGARDIAQFLINNANESNDGILVRGAFLGGETRVLRYYLNNDLSKISVADYFGSYQPGNLLDLKKRSINEVISTNLVDKKRIWYYDFTYSSDAPTAIMHTIGIDKENQKIILYEINQ